MAWTHRWGGSRQMQKKAKADNSTERPVTIVDPSSHAAEAYRTLRTNLLHGFVDGPKIILITSYGPGEGKSSTCANLAVVLAQTGKNVLAVDCDLRKPRLHRYFGLRNIWGIGDILMGVCSLEDVWEEPIEKLKVVSAGSIPPNPTECLDSSRLAEFLAKVREEFDYVLLDSSPVGLVSDPAILATQSDGVLLVLDAQSTRKAYVRQSVRSLEAVGANVMGTVVNNIEKSNGDPYHRYYT